MVSDIDHDTQPRSSAPVGTLQFGRLQLEKYPSPNAHSTPLLFCLSSSHVCRPQHRPNFFHHPRASLRAQRNQGNSGGGCVGGSGGCSIAVIVATPCSNPGPPPPCDAGGPIPRAARSDLRSLFSVWSLLISACILALSARYELRHANHLQNFEHVLGKSSCVRY